MRALRLIYGIETCRIHYSQQHDDLPKNIINLIDILKIK